MRFGAKRMLIPSLLFIGAGMLLFARTPIAGSYFADVARDGSLVGIGAGLAFPALMTLAMSGATPERLGLASGLVNTSVQVGAAVGLAVLATLATERPRACWPTASRRCPRSTRLPPGLRRRRRRPRPPALVIAITVLRGERRGGGAGGAERGARRRAASPPTSMA